MARNAGISVAFSARASRSAASSARRGIVVPVNGSRMRRTRPAPRGERAFSRRASAQPPAAPSVTASAAMSEEIMPGLLVPGLGVGSFAACRDDPHVDAARGGGHEALGQRVAQAGEPRRRGDRRPARRSCRARGPRGGGRDDVVGLAHDQMRAEHRGELAQRGEAARLLVGGAGRAAAPTARRARRRAAAPSATRGGPAAARSARLDERQQPLADRGRGADLGRDDALGVDLLGDLPQRHLAQRGEVLDPEEAVQRRLDARRRVDLAGAQPVEQRLGREVDQHDLVGALKHVSGTVSRTRTPLSSATQVVERLEVLDVERREHVDAGGEHVLDVLVALGVLEPGGVGVRELVDQADLGRARRIAGRSISSTVVPR